MFSFSDSMLFLTNARNALVSVVDESAIDPNRKAELSRFVKNEATDYQVMSLVINEELPDEKYNLKEEMALFDDLETMVFESGLDEWIGIDMPRMVKSLGPVYPMSSSKVVMEALEESKEILADAKANRDMAILSVLEANQDIDPDIMIKWTDQVLSEITAAELKKLAIKKAAAVKKAIAQKTAPYQAKALSKKAAAKGVIKGKGLATGKGASAAKLTPSLAAKAKGAIAQKIAPLQAKALSKKAAAKGVVKGKGLATGKGAGTAAAKAAAAPAKTTSLAAKVKGAIAQKAAPYQAKALSKKAAAKGMVKGKGLATGKGAAGAPKAVSVAAKIKGAIAQKAAPLQAKALMKKGAARGAVKGKGLITGKGAAAAVKTAAPGALKAAALKGAAVAAPVAAVALAGVAAHKVYQRFFSQAAKACGGQSGQAKTMCMKKAKRAAIGREIGALRSGSAKCGQSNNPAKCKAAIAKKVAGLQAKAQRAAA